MIFDIGKISLCLSLISCPLHDCSSIPLNRHPHRPHRKFDREPLRDVQESGDGAFTTTQNRDFRPSFGARSEMTETGQISNVLPFSFPQLKRLESQIDDDDDGFDLNVHEVDPSLANAVVDVEVRMGRHRKN